MPCSLNTSASLSNPGNCWFEQVGVKAPGKPNRITFLSLKYVSVFVCVHCASDLTLKVTLGNLSPCYIILYS